MDPSLPTAPLRAPPNYQYIHLRRLTMGSNIEYGTLPLPKDTPQTVEHRDKYALVPRTFLSKETLVCVGFNEDVAAELWSQWTNWPDDQEPRDVDGGTFTFRDLAMDVFESTDDCEDVSTHNGTMAWLDLMDEYGLARELQEAIVDPAFRDMRERKSCWVWIIETILCRFDALEEVLTICNDRAAGSTDWPEPEDLVHAVAPPTALDDDASAPRPGSTAVYKAVPHALTLTRDDVHGVDLSGILAVGSGDFHTLSDAYVMTTQYSTAVRDAQWLKRRCGVFGVKIVRIDIPDSGFQWLAGRIWTVRWSSPEWRSMVYHCRTNLIPHPVQTMLDSGAIFVGDVCRAPTLAFTQGLIRDPSELGDAHVAKTKRDYRDKDATMNEIQVVFHREGAGLLEYYAETRTCAILTAQELHQLSAISA